ncbi:hypothetical protein ACGTN6_18945 [Halomonas sp. THAF12]|uniref:hypothetical protein n=1 Tax=Halomonas sp. B23F22_10 TaxID=3459515 RepID=UPI00373E1C0E
MKRMLLSVGILAGIGVALLAGFLSPFVDASNLEAMNRTAAPIELTVSWRDHTRSIGGIAPGETLAFAIDDEAAITFIVEHADGKIIESDPMYFTPGLVVRAEVHDAIIKVDYE